MKKVCAYLIFALSFTIYKALATPPTINSTVYSQTHLGSFNGIIVGGPINVVVTLGDKEDCRFEGDEEAIESLVAQVEGNSLVIRPQVSWKSWAKKYENKKITAFVSARNLVALTMSGSGNMVVNGIISNKKISITLSGSGSIKANVDADHLSSTLSGSGTLNISGASVSSNLVLSGSGAFAGKNFEVNTFTATVSGSGSTNIHVEKSISATIFGSGNINYTGNATVEKTVVGSGKITKV